MPATQRRNKNTRKKKKKGITGKVILYLLILISVCIILFIGNKLSSGSVRRVIYMIGSGITGDVLDPASISIDKNEFNVYHSFRRGLAVISPNQLSVYKMSGEKTFTEPLLFRTPAVSGCHDSFAAYDRNGINFAITNGKKILLRGEAPAKITKMSMNKNGAFTLITDGPDCKSMVTVYNSSMKEIYKLYSSEQFVFDAILSNDTKSMAVLGYSAKNGGFEGTVMLYKLNSENPIATFPLPDDMPISADFQASNTLLVLTEDSLITLKANGEKQTLLSFKASELNGFSFEDKFYTMLLDGNLSGGEAQLIAQRKNEEHVSVDISDDVFGISTAGNYIAIGFLDRIEVYSSNLNFINKFTITTDIEKFIIREDGTVLSIGDNYAKLLIP